MRAAGDLLANSKSEFDGVVIDPAGKITMLEAESRGMVAVVTSMLSKFRGMAARLDLVAPLPSPLQPSTPPPSPPLLPVASSEEDGRVGVLHWLERRTRQPVHTLDVEDRPPLLASAQHSAAKPVVSPTATTPAAADRLTALLEIVQAHQSAESDGGGASPPADVFDAEAILESKASPTSLKEDLKKMDAVIEIIRKRGQGVATVQTKEHRRLKLPQFAIRLPPADELQIHYVVGPCRPAIGEDVVSIGGIFKTSFYRYLLGKMKLVYQEDPALTSALPCPPVFSSEHVSGNAEDDNYEVIAPQAEFAEFIADAMEYQTALQARVATGLLSYWVPLPGSE